MDKEFIPAFNGENKKKSRFFFEFTERKNWPNVEILQFFGGVLRYTQEFYLHVFNFEQVYMCKRCTIPLAIDCYQNH